MSTIRFAWVAYASFFCSQGKAQPTTKRSADPTSLIPFRAAPMLQYHNRARDYFKITQIAWDSLQAQPANMSSSAAAAATAAARAKAASAAAASKLRWAKRRPSSAKGAAAAAAAVAAAAAADTAAKDAAAAAAAARATAVPALPASNSHPYQTKAGVHAKAVQEQQLLSRPKTTRAPRDGVRKDLVTGRMQVCSARVICLHVKSGSGEVYLGWFFVVADFISQRGVGTDVVLVFCRACFPFRSLCPQHRPPALMLAPAPDPFQPNSPSSYRSWWRTRTLRQPWE